MSLSDWSSRIAYPIGKTVAIPRTITLLFLKRISYYTLFGGILPLLLQSAP